MNNKKLNAVDPSTYRLVQQIKMTKNCSYNYNLASDVCIYLSRVLDRQLLNG